MGKTSDLYKTISSPSEEVLYKDRKSKFYGYAFPLQNETEVKPLIQSLRKMHPSANHVCYAWQLGISDKHYRANDDGEPNNSAGMPIYGQIQAYGVTNVLVAVVRIFGGSKLGVGGLIQAYKSAAQMALEHATIVSRTLKVVLRLNFPYAELDKVMRLIKKQQLEIISQQMELECSIQIAVRQNDIDTIESLFGALHKISVKRSG